MPKPAPRRNIPWRLIANLSLWILVFASAAWAATRVEHFVLTDSHFDLSPDSPALTIQGLQFASRARVMQIFAPDFGLSAFHSPLAERRRRLLAIDWVQDASVSRLWPNRLVVRIVERKPTAFVHLAGGRTVLIDAHGVLLGLPPKTRFDFPVLTGVTEDQPERDRRERVTAMQDLLSQLGPDAKQISEVNTTNVEDLRVTTDLDQHGIELWMGDRNFASRYQHFIASYPEIRKTSGNSSVFDLRLDDRITTKQP
jgi:cell division protein FtsQ